jgi:hypothetical protein
MDQNFLDLLQLFDQHDVKYLIIGGYAVSFYAEPRYTKDIDFWVECSLSNGRRILRALEEFGAPLATISAHDFALPGTAYTAGLPPLRFDVLTRVSGGNFREAFPKRKTVMIGKVPLHYVPLEALMRLKKSAGRPQDKIDLQKLKTFAKIPSRKLAGAKKKARRSKV